MEKLPVPKKKGWRRGSKVWDWTALMVTWLQSDPDMNLHQFMIAQGLPITGQSYGLLKKHKFQEKKDALNERIITRISRKAENTVVQRWEKNMRIWQAVESHVAAHLRASVRDGKIIRLIDANELSALSISLERALKMQRLIVGESTERIAGEVSHHLDVLRLLRDIKSANRLKDFRQQTLEAPEPLQDQGQEEALNQSEIQYGAEDAPGGGKESESDPPFHA